MGKTSWKCCTPYKANITVEGQNHIFGDFWSEHEQTVHKCEIFCKKPRNILQEKTFMEKTIVSIINRNVL